jgi:predicted PurR-regulated permease PerM
MNGIKEVSEIAKDAQKAAKRAEKGIKDIQNQIKDITRKIAKFGTTFISLITDAIVNPFLSLFAGLKTIFNQIFGIFIAIGDKIVSLPHCILFYITDSIFSTVTSVSNAILPRFITIFFGTIYSYMFQPVIKWVLNLFDYYDANKKCYSFNVNSEVNKITNEFKKMGTSFENGFGKFDLKKLL